MSSGPTTEPVVLTAADGVRLEGERRVPAGAWGAAVLAHPHPLYGGDMRTNVPAALFDALPAAGVAALRFNFRGVGRSEGSHGGGPAERLDVVAAIDGLLDGLEAAGARAGLPLVLCGYSFGGDVTLAVDDPRVAGWCAVAAPLGERAGGPVAAADPRPTVLLAPEHDQFRPPDDARAAAAGWTATRVEAVPGTDHSLLGRTDRVAEACLRLLRDLADGPAADPPAPPA